jgi:hypothetical protein
MQIKMKNIYMLSLIAALALAAGCSINHPIEEDYNQYLANNQGVNTLPKTELEADYSISKETINHRYEFRAATVGYGHLWIVEFGKILDDTLKSKNVQDAFGRLEESVGNNISDGNFISFTLESYEFKDFRACISLSIVFSDGGNVVLEKTYYAEGGSQGGKMFWGGPFAMKNATQQSTKLALDKILGDFIQDVNVKLAAAS